MYVISIWKRTWYVLKHNGRYLSSMKWRLTLVQLDSIGIFSKTTEYHTDEVRKVLIVLNNAAATVKLKTARLSRRLMIISDMS